MLNFYIVNCIICFVLFLVSCIRIKRSVRRQGYEEVLQKKKEASRKDRYEDRFITIVKILAACLIPLLNTVFAIAFLIMLFLNDKKLDELVREEMIKNGLVLNSIIK